MPTFMAKNVWSTKLLSWLTKNSKEKTTMEEDERMVIN